MFDLHMHTQLSDGELSVNDLVEKVKEAHITCFSITDHNHSKAYDFIDELDVKLIPGTEIATSFKGVIIEFLGYGVDSRKINTWYDEFFSVENLKKNELQLFHDLKVIAVNNSYNVDHLKALVSFEKGASKKKVFKFLSEKYENFEFKTYKEFFRKGLSNPKSSWFVDEGRFYPKPEEVVNLIHESNGLCFVAHPYEYGFDDVTELFEFAQQIGVDGIECYHPSASFNQSVALVKYCVDHDLKASGGSDYHRNSKGIPLGVHLQESIYSLKCFDWIRGI